MEILVNDAVVQCNNNNNNNNNNSNSTSLENIKTINKWHALVAS